jgi:hypothetical protein
MTVKTEKTEAGEKPALKSEVLEREVISPISMMVNGKIKEIKVGEVIKVSKENAAIFSKNLAEVGFLKTRQGRKANVEKKLDEAEAKIVLLEKELTQSKATNVAFKAEIERLRALVK